MKMRLDQYIVELGLAKSRNIAQDLIKDGSVSLNEEVCNKPAKHVKKGARVSLVKKRQWVSRGGEKLYDALKSFEINADGKIALDVGSSTGGFTQVLLQEGAEKIVAVDVGTNQLHHSLRSVKRISILEKTDIRDVSSKFEGFFDLVVVDVAFISIEKVIKDIEATAKKGGHIVLLYKPQFEAGKKNISKNGLVKKETEVQKMLIDFLNTLDQSSLYFVQSKNAHIKGKKGNQEIFVHLKRR